MNYCRRCGVPVDAPFHLCPSHAPAHRATAHKSYMLHRAAVLARQRARNARPPVVPEPCLECSGPVPPYSGRNRRRTYCSETCRQRHDDRRRSPRLRARKETP